MADGTKDERQSDDGNRTEPLPDDAALSARLGRLDHQLSTLKDSRTNKANHEKRLNDNASARASAMARGLRLSTELVVGVLVGAALGWTFDYFLSTSPWGFIVFFLLGFVAGLINLMRVAGVVPDVHERLGPPPENK
jgi:ATP synthase protein I